MADLRQENFTNQFGQVINIGDEVMYAATSWKDTYHNKGIYSGVYYDFQGKPWALKVSNISSKKWIYNYDTKQGYYESYERSACLPLKRVFKLA